MSRRHQPVTSPSQEAGAPERQEAAPTTGFKLRVALTLLAIWSMLPPYLGPVVGLELNVADKLEVVDHIIAGGLVALCAGLAAFQVRREPAAEDSTANLFLIGVCALGGLWQVVTHAPLVFDAGDAATPWDSVILHSSPGPVLVLLSIWIFMREPETQPAPQSS